MRSQQRTRVLLGLCMVSCAVQDEVRTTPTQITVSVECRNEELRRRIGALRVIVARASTGGAGQRVWQGVRTESAEIPARTIQRWPAEVPVLPSSEAENDAVFEVVVDALDQQKRSLAQVRGITRFGPGEWLRFPLSLETCDGDGEGIGFVCTPDPECHGRACLFCGSSGTCEEVLFTDPDTLPELDDAVPNPAADGTSDASMSVPMTPGDGGADVGAGGASPSCDEGVLRCGESSERARERCSAGRWTLTTPCAAGFVCARVADGARCETSGTDEPCSGGACRDASTMVESDAGSADADVVMPRPPVADASLPPPRDAAVDASTPSPDASTGGPRDGAVNPDATVVLDASRGPADASDRAGANLADTARAGGI